VISVFVVGTDCNLYIKFFQRDSNGILNWSDWRNLTGPGSPLTNNVLSLGQQGSSIAVVYSNFRTTNPTTTPLNQFHVIVVDGNQNVWDENYFDDVTINYNPDPTTGPWSLQETNVTVSQTPVPQTQWNAVGAAATPPGTIAVFADQGNVGFIMGNLANLFGQQLIEEDGPLPSTTGTLTVDGPFSRNDSFLAAPVPVTLGKQGADCDTTRSCKNAVFFITDATGPGGNIQYSIWGVDKPADAWDFTVGTNGIKMVGSASQLFNANPAAVVSQNGTSVYVFAARANPSLCIVGGIHQMDCGNVYYAHFTP
jgi:hypothetical protein